MDLSISSRGGNYSAVNGFAPRTRKIVGFSNFADSNAKAVGIQTKKQVQKKRSGTKKRPLKYKQNMGK